MMGTPGWRSLHACHDGLGRLDDPALELLAGKPACPGVEDLQHVGTRSDLPGQIFDGSIDQTVDERPESGRIPS